MELFSFNRSKNKENKENKEKDMNNFILIKQEIEDQLGKVRYNNGDLSDIGNEIGIVIANYFDNNNTIEDFIIGLKHGVSLTDGSHDKKD